VDFPHRTGRRTIQLKLERMNSHALHASLNVDGTLAGAIEIPRTWPTHGTTAGLTSGHDAGAPVSDAYERPFPFTGRHLRVTIELESDRADGSGAAYRATLQEQ
jgi:hypothetical protein